jgi:hypothetical protein
MKGGKNRKKKEIKESDLKWNVGREKSRGK